MGDEDPHIAATIAPLGALLAQGRFAPASVQRDYRWRQAQCDALLGDLLRAFAASGLDPDTQALPPAPEPAPEPDADASPAPQAASEEPSAVYFLGAMMLAPDGDGRFFVYDGLQRLATLTVALACLRDWSDPAPDGVRGLLHDESGQARLALPFADHTLAHDVLRENGTRAQWRNAEGLTDAGLRLREAIVIFRRAVRRMSQPTREAFGLFLRTRVLLAVLTISAPPLARQAFVTVNDRGLALDSGDVLKGQLIDLASAQSADLAAEMASAWDGLSAIAGDRFETILRAADFLIRAKPQGPDALHRLFDHLALSGADAAATFVLETLPQSAAAYARIRAHEGLDEADGFDAACRRLALLPFQDWLPVAIRIAQRSKPGRALRDMQALARSSMIVMLKGYSSRDRAIIYGRAIRQMAERRNPFNGALSFSDHDRASVVGALALPFHESDTRAALVRWLETLFWEERLPRTIIDRKASVEHILPLRPARGSDWLAAFPDPEARAALADTIGNLALIPSDENYALGNKDFEEKRARFSKLRPHWRLLEGLQTVPRWTPEALRARTARLKHLAVEALHLA